MHGALAPGAFSSALSVSEQCSLVTDNTVCHRTVSCTKELGRENVMASIRELFITHHKTKEKRSGPKFILKFYCIYPIAN